MPSALHTANLRKDARLDVQAINECLELINLGARPVVASTLCGMSNVDAIRLFRMTNNARAPRGQLPSDPNWIFDRQTQQVEATAFVALYREAARLTPSASQAKLLISTWSVHKSRYASPRLDINRAYVILKLLKCGDIQLSACKSCKAAKLIRPIDNDCHRCPVCRSAKERSEGAH